MNWERVLRNTGRGLVAAVNIPVIVTWWLITLPLTDVKGRIPVLFALLLIGMLGMTILPVAVTRFGRRRWLLLASMGLVMMFWSLQWIEACDKLDSFSVEYARRRAEILLGMLASLAGIAAVYAAISLRPLLMRKRPPAEA